MIEYKGDEEDARRYRWFAKRSGDGLKRHGYTLDTAAMSGLQVKHADTPQSTAAMESGME